MPQSRRLGGHVHVLASSNVGLRERPKEDRALVKTIHSFQL